MLAAGFFSAASLGKLVPHLDWMASRYGVSLGLAGFALSCVMLPGALAGLSFGALADRLGAKRIALTGLALAAAASLAGGYADSFGVLVALRIIEGAGYSLFVIPATVLAVELLPGRSALALSIWSGFAPVGFALGQWAGAFAAGENPLPAIGAAHAAALAAATLAVYFVAPPSRRRLDSASGWSVARQGSVQRTAFAFGATCAVLIAAVALAPVVLAARSGLSVPEVASLTALASLPGLVGRIAPGWLLGRGAQPLAVFIAATSVAALSIALALHLPLWPALALFVVFQISAGALPGLLSAMMSQVAEPGQLGSVSGICTQVINIGNLLGPPIALAAWAAGGTAMALAFLVGLLAAALAAIAGLGVYRRRLAQ